MMSNLYTARKLELLRCATTDQVALHLKIRSVRPGNGEVIRAAESLEFMHPELYAWNALPSRSSALPWPPSLRC